MSDTPKADKVADSGLRLTTDSTSSRNFDLALKLVECMGTLAHAAHILAKTCQWSEDADGNWGTACGEIFSFFDGGPKENKANWCQYCGGELVAVPYPSNVDMETRDQ